MTPDQITLVQESFEKVLPVADHISDLFYDRLFATAPEIRPLFSDDLADQKKENDADVGVGSCRAKQFGNTPSCSGWPWGTPSFL
mmetsp:Transcript_28515/g.53542  ORF Transcript_28515/g.53542 Transcript_28515/m.53542 type:complete len:85 (+) Transcript_28515:556-810(+)